MAYVDEIDQIRLAIQGASNPGELEFLQLKDAELKHVRWLDKPFLQASAFHLLAGRKGTCKGTYIASVVARLSRGEFGENRRSIVVTSEDSIGLDFKPRVLAAKGDPEFVTILKGDFRLPRDIDWLHIKALEMGDVGMIVIDPVGNHLSDTDTDGEGSVRNAIAALNELADDLGCMVFGVRHLTKDSTKGALASVLGSTAWVDVPRCVILMAADDEDPDWTFHYQVIAGNRGPKGKGRKLTLHVIDLIVPDDTEPFEEITMVTEEGQSEKDVEELLTRSESKSDKKKGAVARDSILEKLEGGKTECDTLEALIAAEAQMSARTVRDTRMKLANEGLVRSYPERNPDGTIKSWWVERTNAPLPAAVPTLAKSSGATTLDPESLELDFT